MQRSGWGINVPLLINLGVLGLIVIIGLSVAVTDREVMREYLDSGQESEVLVFWSTIDDEFYNLLEVYPIIEDNILDIEELNHSKTFSSFNNYEKFKIGDNELTGEVYYFNNYTWNSINKKPTTTILLYDFPDNISQEKNITLSKYENRTISLENSEVIFELPEYFNFAGGYSNSPKLFMSMKLIITIKLVNNENTDEDWNFEGIYFLNKEYITYNTKIIEIRQLVYRLYDQMVEIWKPYSNTEYIDEEVRSPLLFSLESMARGGPYSPIEQILDIYAPILIIIGVVPLYIINFIVRNKKETYELLYTRGKSHQTLIISLVTWASVIPNFVTLFVTLIVNLFFVNSGIKVDINLIGFFLISQFLGSTWIVLRHTRLFRATTEYKGFAMIISRKIKIRIYHLLGLIGLIYVIPTMIKLISFVGNFETSFWNFGLPRGLVYRIVLGIVALVLAIMYRPIELNKIRFSGSNRILKRMMFDVFSKQKLFGLLLVILTIWSFSNYLWFEIYIADTQTKGNNNLLGDYQIFAYDDELAQKLSINPSLIKLLEDHDEITDIVFLSYIVQDLVVEGKTYSIEINLVNQTQYNNFDCKECKKADIDFSESLWVSNAFFRSLNRKDEPFEITGTPVSKYNFDVLNEELNFRTSETNIFTSFSNWKELGLSPYSKYQDNIEILLNSNGITKEDLETLISKTYNVTSSSFKVHKIDNIESYAQEYQKYSNQRIISLFLLALTISIISTFILYIDHDWQSSLFRISKRYGSKVIARNNFLFIRSMIIILTIGSILGVILAVYGSSINSSLFGNSILKFRYDLVIDKLLLMFGGFILTYTGFQFILMKLSDVYFKKFVV